MKTPDTTFSGREREQRTLVTPHARRQGVDVGAMIGDSNRPEERVLSELETAGSIDYALNGAREFVGTAQGFLEPFPKTPTMSYLRCLAESVLHRAQ